MSPREPDDEPVVELKPFEAQRFFEEGDVIGDPVPDAMPADPEADIESAPAAPSEGDAQGDAEVSADGEAIVEPEASANAGAPHIDVAHASDSQHDLFAGVDEPPRIPGYVVEGVIGRGATGVVYRARQEAVERPVALKVLHRELITNRRAVKRLKREARLAARLAHPSIISAIDLGVQDGLWWYAMELVEGVSLSRRIAERGSLTERECLRLFSPLCDALQHAHEVGVVHRDIKPANILVDRRGRARLVDLGLAMGHNDPSITKTGSTLGTPHYVSPEQARDPSKADIRSDLWSLGATMYHAVCGRPPFSFEDGETSGGVAEILSRVLYKPVVDPREYSPELSKGFALLLRKCLTRDTEQRYQEPWELVADIETLRERRRLDLRGSQIDAFASRRPAWVGRALGAAGLVAVIVVTWAITARPWEERAPSGPISAQVSVGDWPELRSIRDGFEGGTLMHADALLELRSPELESLPARAKYFQNELVVRVKDALQTEVDATIQSARERLDRALRTRDFPAAQLAIGGEFMTELRRRTGYAAPADLPAGSVARRAQEFVDEESQRLGTAKVAAIGAAESALESALDRLLKDEHTPLVESGRFQEAIDWLSLGSTTAWLTRDGVDLDLRGLGEDERRQIARSIAIRLSWEQSFVTRTAASAVETARETIDRVEKEFLDDITDGIVTDKIDAAVRFTSALSQRLESTGFRATGLPPELEVSFNTRVEAASDRISRAESQRRETLALVELRRLEQAAAASLAKRDYSTARDLFEEARAESWRSSTFDAIDPRIVEVARLQEFMDRAVAGIEAAAGKPIVLTFAGIRRAGTVSRDAGDLLRGGFRFRTRDRSPSRQEILVRVTDVSEVDPDRSSRVSAEDLRNFAGLGEDQSLGPKQRLTLAAFWLAEGKPRQAARVLPVNDPPAAEALLWSLNERIRAAVAASAPAKTQGADQGEPGPEPGVAEEKATIASAYGTPNQATSGDDVHVVWHFVDEPMGDVELDAPLKWEPARSAERFGSWRSGLWRRSVDGLTLDTALPDRTTFFASSLGPTLPLVAPVDLDQEISVVLHVTPGDAHPDGHLFCVSLQGYHALFVDSYAWFGRGDLRALYKHVNDGRRSSYKEFEAKPCIRFQKGQTVKVCLAIRGKTLEALTVNGRDLKFHRFLGAASPLDHFVRLRSRGPMILRTAELFAEKR